MTARLMCKDGEVIEVDATAASQSVLIKGLIEDSGLDEEIPIGCKYSSKLARASPFLCANP